MKNLFKNLMLVAVAAMAFTACTETNDEVNAVVEKTVLKFVAGFADDTRSGFNGETGVNEDDKTTYKSSWDGNEKLKVCANGEFASAQEVDIEDTEGHFTVVFEGTTPTLIDVFSPASAWSSENYPTIPAEQTPRAKSVDPAAHILKAQAADVASGMVTMQHMVAYGKMTVNAPEDFVIDHVVVNLKGSYFSYAREYSYTINADNVENNTFWFATEPIDVEEFTVTAYAAGDKSVTKTVDMTGKEKPLAFNHGQVSTFSVSNLQVPVSFEPDVVATDIQWNDATNKKCFTLTAPGFDYIDLEVNSANRPNNNSLVVGDYTYGKNENQFRIKYYKGGVWNYGDSSGTMNVSFVNGEYIIIINVTSVYLEAFKGSIGYKGMPDEWVAPSEGGDEPDPVQLAKPTVNVTDITANSITVSWSAVENASNYAVAINGGDAETVADTSYTFTGLQAETSYEISVVAKGNGTEYLDSEKTTVNPTTLPAGGDEPEPEPEPEPDPEVPDGYVAVEYVSATTGSYWGRAYNWIGDFAFNYQGEAITFTMCDFNGPMQMQNKDVKEGVYTNNGNGANQDTKELYNISIAGTTGGSNSTVEVSKDGTDYVFKMTMITVNGTYKFYYKGAL